MHMVTVPITCADLCTVTSVDLMQVIYFLGGGSLRIFRPR